MRTVFVIVMLAVIALAAMGGLSGCARFNTIVYDDSDRYTAGEAEFTERIESIDIDWISGSVKVVSHPGDTVRLTEKAQERMPEDLRMHWWLEGSTLHVRFAQSGASLRLFNAWSKDLTLELPESVRLEDISVRTVSAGIEADGLTAEEISVSTTSGEVNVSCEADDIDLGGVSGSIHLIQCGDAGKVSIGTTSGEIRAELEHAQEAHIASVSGEISLTAACVDALAAKTTSGEISCALKEEPSECDIHSVSGAVALRLPEDAEFTASVQTVSGDFESDFALKKDGRTYTCGSGDAEIEIGTTSGDVSIRQR